MNFTDTCSILAGTSGRDGAALVTVMNDGLAEERQQHAIPLLYRQGSWILAGEEKVLPWLAAGIANIHCKSMEFAIVGWAGQVLLVEEQKSRREGIVRNEDYVSIVRSVATIDNTAYTAGMRRQVHKRLGDDQWTEVDHGCIYYGAEPAVGFNAIDGFDGDEIYAVGLNGEIWHQSEDLWQSMSSPTNVHLHSICCGDEQVYIGGRCGLLIQGKHDTWKILDFETNETVWDLHWFEDELYILLDKGIYRQAREQPQRIENNVVGDAGFHSLSSVGGKLWAFGPKKIVQYDGSSWSELDCALPDNIHDEDLLGFFNDKVLTSGSNYLDDE